jgi:peptidoglycan/xylan/chitin deacetylase (PgdA/CDA1 family)
MDVSATSIFEKASPQKWSHSIGAETHPLIEASVYEKAAPGMGVVKTASLAPDILNGVSTKGPKLSYEVSKTTSPVKRTIQLPLPHNVTRGSKYGMDLSVTFDGGSQATEAEQILNALRERGIRTTIFLTGIFIREHPELVRQMLADGHEIGNHTMTHPHLTAFAKGFHHTTLPYVTKGFLARELRLTEEAYMEVTGERMPPIWRAPYGEVNREIIEWAFEEGYIHIGWTADYRRRESLDTLDWVHDKGSKLYLTSVEIKQKVLNFGKGTRGLNGGIILMHLGTERTEDRASGVLGEMLDGLTEMGYRFVKVSKLVEGNDDMETVLKEYEQLVMRTPR